MTIATAPLGNSIRQRPNYGIDSPAMVASEAGIGTVALALAVFLPHWRWLAITIAVEFLALALSMVVYSKHGKFSLREMILDSIPWKGDEVVLDIGCGRGLLLISAAKRAPNGRAVGVDIWDRSAITRNSPLSVRENAAIEEVASRIELVQGDARSLPLADATFDAVLSNFVVHEVNTATDREQIMKEALRVLKPGGRLALVDFIFTGHCVEILRRLGMRDARRIRLGGLSALLGKIFMFGTFQVHLVTGTKSGDPTPSVDLQ